MDQALILGVDDGEWITGLGLGGGDLCDTIEAEGSGLNFLHHI
jgi:hypothetical protein